MAGARSWLISVTIEVGWHATGGDIAAGWHATPTLSTAAPVTGGKPCHSRPNTRGSLRKSHYGCQQWAGPWAYVWCRGRPRSTAAAPSAHLMAPAPVPGTAAQ